MCQFFVPRLIIAQSLSISAVGLRPRAKRQFVVLDKSPYSKVSKGSVTCKTPFKITTNLAIHRAMYHALNVS